MRAILYHDVGSEANVPVSYPNRGEVLIKVHCFGLNEMDILQNATENFPLAQNASPIMGTEFSGVIVGSGPEPSGEWSIGDEVYGICPRGGACAEYIVVDTQYVLKKPSELSFRESAGLVGPWLSALIILREVLDFQPRETIAVLGAATALGNAMVQACQLLGCRRVFAGVDTNLSAPSYMKLKASLPDEVIPFKTGHIHNVITSINKEGVNYIVDLRPKPDLSAGISSLKSGGVYLYAAPAPARAMVNVDMVSLVFKGISVIGLQHARAQPTPRIINQQKYLEEHIIPRILTGRLPLHLANKTFRMKTVKDAIHWLTLNHEAGKVVIEIV